MQFQTEAQLGQYIRELIAKRITKKNKNIYALENKKVVDIVICRDGRNPALFFIEVKYHRNAHGRLGFGGEKGGGFQPEVLSIKPNYFERNLRWIMASEEFPNRGVLFLDSKTVRKYISGGAVGQKFNNIQKRIFSEVDGYKREQLVGKLIEWLKTT